MHRLAEPVPESRLADVLMGELFPRQEIDDTFVDLVLDDLELGDPVDNEHYFVYEIIRDALATAEFVRVRDTRYDHIVTVEFPRATRDELGVETAPTPKFSAPYERIEIAHDDDQIEVERISLSGIAVDASGEIATAAVAAAAAVDEDEMQLDLDDLEIEQDFFAQGDAHFMSYAQARPFPLYSAPFEKVELGELPIPTAIADDSTEMVVARRTGTTRAIALAVVLTCAIAAVVGLALLVVRSATA